MTSAMNNFEDSKDSVVDSIEALDQLLTRVAKASEVFATFTQEQVDRIFDHASMIAIKHRITLAQLAVEEAGMGVLEDKVLKNHYAAESVHDAYKRTRTCGEVEKNVDGGYAIHAEPVGVLAAIVPCTNPTSTTIFKSLICLKTRNCIVFSPHPRTTKCTIATARIIRDAAIAAGAPEHCIGWIDTPTVDLCHKLMGHPRISMIIATGAGGLVKAAYSSGKPCMGGGSGNTPVVIDETADVEMAVNSIIQSKTFDNGMICASEQSVVAVKEIADQVKTEFEKRGGYFLKSQDEVKRLGAALINENCMMNPQSVGQSATRLADMAKLVDIPEDCRVLLAPLSEFSDDANLSREKLCPCLAFYVEDDYEKAVDRAMHLLTLGGMGHTSVLYTDMSGSGMVPSAVTEDVGIGQHTKSAEARKKYFGEHMKTGRTLICMPTSQGAIGNMYNFCQTPSLSLGCGSWGGNSSAEGLQVKHLLNYKQVAERRSETLKVGVPAECHIGRAIAAESIVKIAQKHCLSRLFIIANKSTLGEVSDFRSSGLSLGVTGGVSSSVSGGVVGTRSLSTVSSSGGNTQTVQVWKRIITSLLESQISYHIHLVDNNWNVPSWEADMRVTLHEMDVFEPDCVVAVGESNILHLGKAVRLWYENPELPSEELSLRFMFDTRRIITGGASLSHVNAGSLTGKCGVSSGIGTSTSGEASGVVEESRNSIKHKRGVESGVKLICVPNDGSDGFEMLPMISLRKAMKYVQISSPHLIPDYCVIDHDLNFVHGVKSQSRGWQMMGVLCNALDGYVSMGASDVTQALATKAIQLIFENAAQYMADPTKTQACEVASYMSGLAGSMSGLGIVNALANHLHHTYRVPMGVAKAVVIVPVIKFNAFKGAAKQGSSSRYERPKAARQYRQLAQVLGLINPTPVIGGTNDEHSVIVDEFGVQALVYGIEKIAQILKVPACLSQHISISKLENDLHFTKNIRHSALAVFDDQCSMSNPRYALVEEIVELLRVSCTGNGSEDHQVVDRTEDIDEMYTLVSSDS